MKSNIIKVGVRWGRQEPIHLGHEAIGKKSIAENDISLLFHGSIGEPQSIKNFFSDKQREDFVRMIFGKEFNQNKLRFAQVRDVRHLGNDQENNIQWVKNLDEKIDLLIPWPKDITFYGGSYEDIHFFEEMGKKTAYVDRYEWPAADISASKVRKMLIGLTETEPNIIIREQRLMDANLVNPIIVKSLINIFEEERETFKQKAVVPR